MSYKIILLLAVSVMTLAVSGSHLKTEATAASASVIEVADGNFTTFLASNKAIMLKYYDPAE